MDYSTVLIYLIKLIVQLVQIQKCLALVSASQQKQEARKGLHFSSVCEGLTKATLCVESSSIEVISSCVEGHQTETPPTH